MAKNSFVAEVTFKSLIIMEILLDLTVKMKSAIGAVILKS